MASNTDLILFQAIKHYSNPANGNKNVLSEFQDDIARINSLKKLFGKYKKRNNLNERLILNHLIILGNVFGVEFSVKLLFELIPKEYYSVLKTFLLFLQYLDEKKPSIENIDGSGVFDIIVIPIDLEIAKVLRTI